MKSNSNLRTYLMILPVQYYRIREQTVALEGAFTEHLKLLKLKILPTYDQFLIGMVETSSEAYEKNKSRLAIIDEQEENIFFKTLYKSENLSSRMKQVRELFSISNRLKKLIKTCSVLHTGLSSNIWFPMEFIATLWGIFLKKKIVYVVDIDFRDSAEMNYKAGRWSFKSYLLCKYIYDKLRSFQIQVAVNHCSLVLLKGKKLCQDFGKGKPHVKNFLDAAHSDHHIIDQAALDQKLLQLSNSNHPLEIVYFGRLVSYKGIDFCLRAIALATQKMGCNLKFHIIGQGDEEEKLKNLTQELGIENNVIFYGALPFNLDFFKQLYTYHLLLAAPLSEDTPRSALDAMAAGIPILAFDTYYYRDLTATGAVSTVPWLSVEALAQQIAEYDQNRQLLAEMVLKAIEFAKQNTQEIWLDKRLDWTLTYTNSQ